jgi:ribosomal protein S18 acetylase RimI-like enzyme
MSVQIQVANLDQAAQILSTTVLAFSTDAFVRWAVPDPHKYLTSYPEVFKVFIDTAIKSQTAYIAEGFSGTAIWIPSDVDVDSQAIAVAIQNLGPSPLNDFVGELFEKFTAFHPSEQHWYMPLMGVDPSCQGRGVGSALLKYALEKCDRLKQLAYLEASSKQNKSLYERHGFETVDCIQVGGSPELYPMIRQPR